MPGRTTLSLFALPLLLLFTTGAAAADFERDFTFAGDELDVVNMIGTVTVTAAAGRTFEVKVVVRGADASADLLQFTEPTAAEPVLAVRFPLKEHSKYVYPALGSGSKTTMHFRDEGDEGKSWLKKIFAGLTGTQVTVRGKGSGLEVWADVTIAVPEGAELAVRHGVGAVEAADLKADLALDTSSGGITVHRLTGNLLADTGSGRITAAGIDGDVNLDTGSGAVEVRECNGAEIRVDTGSGGVVAEDLNCRYLVIDTGSGSVKARRVQADEGRIDTGSGSVVLQLDRIGTGEFLIDTGSGSIELVLPTGASAHITADTGSGSVQSDLTAARVVRQDRGEMEVVAGGGEARVRLDAGSGSIHIREQ